VRKDCWKRPGTVDPAGRADAKDKRSGFGDDAVKIFQGTKSRQFQSVRRQKFDLPSNDHFSGGSM
jgi:hypothetical protein